MVSAPGVRVAARCSGLAGEESFKDGHRGFPHTDSAVALASTHSRILTHDTLQSPMTASRDRPAGPDQRRRRAERLAAHRGARSSRRRAFRVLFPDGVPRRKAADRAGRGTVGVGADRATSPATRWTARCSRFARRLPSIRSNGTRTTIGTRSILSFLNSEAHVRGLVLTPTPRLDLGHPLACERSRTTPLPG